MCVFMFLFLHFYIYTRQQQQQTDYHDVETSCCTYDNASRSKNASIIIYSIMEENEGILR